jgi:hypothetical protein
VAAKTKVTKGAFRAETLWKHFIRQTARSGQPLWHSGMARFSGGQHGMSEAVTDCIASILPVIVVAPEGATSGPARRPSTANSGSNRRMERMIDIDFTISHPALSGKPAVEPTGKMRLNPKF